MRLGRSINSQLCFLVLLASACLSPALAATYEVGPGKPLTSIGAVPWATLQAGDTVLIHWRSTPYKEKWVIARQATAAQPITVSGVPGPAGQLPVIDGAGAVTAPGLNYWSEVRGVVKIGGSNTPPDVMPQYIVIENLEIINAHQPLTFSDDGGNTQSYGKNASGIYLEKGQNITIRGCIFRNNGNGLFIASSDADVSRDILVQGNYLYDNGNLGSAFEHNSYTAGIGIVFEYNRYGPPLAGAIGNNLKDRSAGTVVRYNWIEGGNRQLDLVDAEDSLQIRTDPRYNETHVYGNVLIEPAGAGNRQIVHYGGDSGTTSAYRKGTLYFYNNTVVSTRTDRNTLFRLSTNDEYCDARNNILYSVLAGNDWSMLDETGVLDLSHNWIKPGWANSFSGTFAGTVNNDGTMVQGTAPGFVNEGGQEFSLDPGSVNIDAGTTLDPGVLSAHNVTRQYVKHQASEARLADGTLDIGAYEVFSVAINRPPRTCRRT
ncbi:MAG: right-handed parallel beta-helix repeat-containing protein [Acidobacteria bacterium]|nr:right-handed parallel beta-helix repeat-containing protein [Acidobacteriota bacterium]